MLRPECVYLAGANWGWENRGELHLGLLCGREVVAGVRLLVFFGLLFVVLDRWCVSVRGNPAKVVVVDYVWCPKVVIAVK